jgi:hypothetical protein
MSGMEVYCPPLARPPRSFTLPPRAYLISVAYVLLRDARCSLRSVNAAFRY